MADYKWLTCDIETPTGWDKLLENMCEEVNDYLEKHDLIDAYRVDQIKEKFGSLRWYDNGLIPADLIDKYEILSEQTCAICGKPSDKFTKGWILPICDECLEREEKR